MAIESNNGFQPSEAKILIADDTPANIEVLHRILESQGYVVSVATNGKIAMEIVSRLRPDLILLDIIMPEMDGFETCRLLKMSKDFREIPVIFISAKGEVQDIIKGFGLGGVDYITKPIRHEEVLVRVKTHLHLNYLKKQQAWRIKELELHAQKLEELDSIRNRFLAIAMHDIRNPISSIRGFSDLYLMGEDSFSENEKKELISVIHQSSIELLQLANDLLDISVFESGRLNLKKESGNLRSLILNGIQRHQALFLKKNIEITSNLAEVSNIDFDPNRIIQVLDNLISNAVKFSQPDTKIVVGLMEKADYQEFYVQDQGPGIPAKDRGKLFTEFSQIGNFPTGGEKSTGLGLSIVKKIVDAHSGIIAVDSQEGQGTCFAVQLPKHQGATPV